MTRRRRRAPGSRTWRAWPRPRQTLRLCRTPCSGCWPGRMQWRRPSSCKPAPLRRFYGRMPCMRLPCAPASSRSIGRSGKSGCSAQAPTESNSTPPPQVRLSISGIRTPHHARRRNRPCGTRTSNRFWLRTGTSSPDCSWSWPAPRCWPTSPGTRVRSCATSSCRCCWQPSRAAWRSLGCACSGDMRICASPAHSCWVAQSACCRSTSWCSAAPGTTRAPPVSCCLRLASTRR